LISNNIGLVLVLLHSIENRSDPQIVNTFFHPLSKSLISSPFRLKTMVDQFLFLVKIASPVKKTAF